MTERTELTTVEAVQEDPPWVFTVRDDYGAADEAMLLPCEDGVTAWINRCTHQAQRFDQGMGSPVDDGELRCPRHGSTFDTCDGSCDNGPAANTTLPPVDVTVDDGTVYLVDDHLEFLHEGNKNREDEDDEPSSTSHIGF